MHRLFPSHSLLVVFHSGIQHHSRKQLLLDDILRLSPTILINLNVLQDTGALLVFVTHVHKAHTEEAKVYQVHVVMDLVTLVTSVHKDQQSQHHVQLDNGVMAIRRYVFFHLLLYLSVLFVLAVYLVCPVDVQIAVLTRVV